MCFMTCRGSILYQNQFSLLITHSTHGRKADVLFFCDSWKINLASFTDDGMQLLLSVTNWIMLIVIPCLGMFGHKTTLDTILIWKPSAKNVSTDCATVLLQLKGKPGLYAMQRFFTINPSFVCHRSDLSGASLPSWMRNSFLSQAFISKSNCLAIFHVLHLHLYTSELNHPVIAPNLFLSFLEVLFLKIWNAYIHFSHPKTKKFFDAV